MDVMSTDDLLEGQAQLWNLCFSFLKSMSLKWAIDTGVADVLHRRRGDPMPISELAAELSIPTSRIDALSRLMSALVEMKVFAELPPSSPSSEPAYTLTPASRLLLKDDKVAIWPFITLTLHPIMSDPWHAISEWFRSALTTPFQQYHGKTIWQVANEKPEFDDLFNQGMACDSRLAVEVMLRSEVTREVFRGIGSLVDVAGGTGTVIRSIAESFPEMDCTMLDLPHVVATIEGKENSRVKYVGGDMFVNVPRAQAVLLKWILHDWNDEDCIKILKKCTEAIPSKEEGGKIIIIDMVVGVTTSGHMPVETQLLFDLLMMELTSGTERTESKWKTMLEGAGFTNYKITPLLGLRSIIEVYPS